MLFSSCMEDDEEKEIQKSKEIELLESIIETLKKEKKNYEDRMEMEHEKKLGQLREQHNCKEELYRQAKEEWQGAKHNYEGTIQDMKKQIQQLQHEKESSVQEVRNAQKQVKQLEQDCITNKEHYITCLQIEKDNYNKSLQQLLRDQNEKQNQALLQQQQKQQKQHDIQIVEMKRDNENLSKQMKTLQEQYETFKEQTSKEKAEYCNALEILKSDRDRIQTSWKKEFQDLSGKYEIEKKEWETSNRILQNQIENHIQTIACLNKSNKEFEQNKIMYESFLDSLKVERDTIKNERDRIQNEKDCLLETIERDAAAAESDKRFHEELQRQQQEQEQLFMKQEDAKKNTEKQLDHHHDVEQEQEYHHHEDEHHHHYEISIEYEKEKCEKLEISTKQLQILNEEYNIEISNLKGQLEQLHYQFSCHKKEWNTSIETIKAERDRFLITSTEFQQRLKQGEKEKETFKSTIAQVTKDNDNLRREIQSASVTNNEKINRLQTANKGFKLEKEELLLSLEQSQKEKDAVIEKNIILKDRYNQLKEQIRMESTRYETQIITLQTEKEKSLEAVTKANYALSNLIKESTNYKQEFEKLIQKLQIEKHTYYESACEQKGRMEQLNDELQKTIHKYETTIEQMKMERDAFIRTETELNSKLQTIETKYTFDRNEWESSKAWIKAQSKIYSNEIAEANGRIRQLERQAQKDKEEWESIVEVLNNERDEYATVAAELHGKITLLLEDKNRI